MSAQSPRDSLVELVTPTGTLHGSLLVPAHATPVPVVLIIAGSGPTDRNGNSAALQGKNNSLLLLAEALGDAGIASLRYDKRGIAASAASMRSEADVRFDNYIADAEGWVALLRADHRFSTVTIAGHSEGSLIGMVAAKRAGVDGYVSIAGAGRAAADILREQLKPQLPPAMFEASDSVLRELEAGRVQTALPAAVSGVPGLASLFRVSVQPYLISWFKDKPAVEIARLTIPALIIQGSTDIQVGEVDARALAAAKPDAKLEIIEGMNHIFKLVPADRATQVASYTDPALPIAPKLPALIAAFVTALPTGASH
ncbi:MAG: alpha/beta fold hydrolase [Gemmatimonadales bacterium]